MNQSSEGTISPASSSRIRASSAARSRCASAASRANGGSAGGNGDGTNASTSSPANVVRSYRPVARWLIELGQLGTISLLLHVGGTISFLRRSLGTNSLLFRFTSQVIVPSKTARRRRRPRMAALPLRSVEAGSARFGGSRRHQRNVAGGDRDEVELRGGGGHPRQRLSDRHCGLGLAFLGPHETDRIDPSDHVVAKVRRLQAARVQCLDDTADLGVDLLDARAAVIARAQADRQGASVEAIDLF